MLYFFLIIAAVAMRLLPHIPNFTPIAALALFSGVYLNKKYAFIIPIAALFLSDIFIGFYNRYVMLSVYAGFLLIGLIGLWLKKNKTVGNVIGATLFGSVIFFLITNFAIWATQPYMPHPLYPQSWQGLMQSYIMGLPFFRNSLLGDLFYTGIMFGLAELVTYMVKKYRLKFGSSIKPVNTSY